jgi:molybdopterin synthase catalytic subunit
MRVRVRYFAYVRERLGVSEEWLELPGGADLQRMWEALGARHPVLAALRGRLTVALNQESAGPEAVLSDGDEVALLPPVAGGAGDPQVVDRPIALAEVVKAVGGEECGALVTFTGMVRRHSQGREVVRIDYEAYPEMASGELRAIVQRVEQAHPGTRCAVLHRIGSLTVGEVAVVIAVSAPHRAAAFDGCRMAIEQLKTSVPIWKKEFDAHGGSWVGMGP